MKLVFVLSALFYMRATVSVCAADCAGGMSGTGLAPQNTVLFVWAKTVDDNSTEKSSLIASLGHIYEIVEAGNLKSLEKSRQESAPTCYALRSFPNPFNPATQIHFTLPEENLVAIRIYNLQGQIVRELVQAIRPAGEYSIQWDGRDERGLAVASGVYFLRLEAGKTVKSHKLMLMR